MKPSTLHPGAPVLTDEELAKVVDYQCEVHGLISIEEATGLEEPDERYCPDGFYVLERRPVEDTWYCHRHELYTTPGKPH